MAHLDAAYNLARWLARDERDAEDIVQEACLRAFRFFGSFHGGNARAWLLAIVRNTYYTWLEKNRTQRLTWSSPMTPSRRSIATWRPRATASSGCCTKKTRGGACTARSKASRRSFAK